MYKLAKSRKEEIVFIAIDIIAEVGIQNLSMIKIAERVGISEAALYRHFESKNEMLFFMVDIMDNLLFIEIKKKLNPFNNPIEKLKTILHFQFQFIQRNKGIPQILFSEALQFEDNKLTSKTANILDKFLTLIKEILSEAKSSGCIKSVFDTDAIAVIFLGMIQSTIIIWTLGGCKFSLEKKEKVLWKTFSLLLR